MFSPMETKSTQCKESLGSHSVGVSILTDRSRIALEMGKRILSLPNVHLEIATSSAEEFLETVRHGTTRIEIIYYRSLAEYSKLESELPYILPGRRKYVLAWVATYELSKWVTRHGFNGVITHFDFSCTTPNNLVDIIRPTSHHRPHPPSPEIDPPIGPISYKDHIDEEIAAMIASGMADQEISNHLYLSLQTIRNRVSRMLHDSGVRNRTHLAMIYLTSLETFIE